MSDTPEEIEIRRTSSDSAEATPIVLRKGPRSRLVFIPQLVNNPKDAAASVKGTVVYQKLNDDGTWDDLRGEHLTKLKKGEGYQLELHSAELLLLLRELRGFYRLHRSEGLPSSQAKYVRLTASIIQFLALGQAEIADFLNAHPKDATRTLVRMLEWAASARDPAAVLEKLEELSAEQIPYITALLGSRHCVLHSSSGNHSMTTRMRASGSAK